MNNVSKLTDAQEAEWKRERQSRIARNLSNGAAAQRRASAAARKARAANRSR